MKPTENVEVVEEVFEVFLDVAADVVDDVLAFWPRRHTRVHQSSSR